MLHDQAYYHPLLAKSGLTGVHARDVEQRPEPTAVAESPFVRRSVGIALLVGVPLSTLFLWLALRGVDLTQVRQQLEAASWPWLGGVLASFLGVYVCFALRWRHLLNNVGSVRLRQVIELVFAGAALSNTIPGRPGEAMRGVAVARDAGIGRVAGLASVVVDRACDVVVLVAALLAALLVVPHPGWLTAIVVASVALGALVVLVLALAWWRVHGSGQRFRGERGSRGRIREAASSFVQGLAAIRSARDVATLLALTGAAWGLFGLGAWCCAEAMGLSLTTQQILFLTTVVNLGVAIPSSPGFIGTYQWLVISALGVSDVSKSAAFAYSILLHALSFVPVTLLGYVALASVVRRRASRIAYG